MSAAGTPSPPFDGARLTAHALESLRDRGLDPATVRWVLREPDEWALVRPGRVLCQSLVEESGAPYLYRVFVDVEPEPGRIVTAYRTSKIAKYRRDP
jgi:hypothetical protein